MPRTSASCRAIYLAPMPESAPTLMCCKYPSLISASGSPFQMLLSKIKPQNRPGRTQYFSWVIAP